MYYNKFITQTVNSFEMRRGKRRWVRWDDVHTTLSLQEAHHYFLISKDRTIRYPVRKTHTHTKHRLVQHPPSILTSMYILYTQETKMIINQPLFIWIRSH